MRDVPAVLQQLEVPRRYGEPIVVGQGLKGMLLFSIDLTGPKALGQSQVVSVPDSLSRICHSYRLLSHVCELQTFSYMHRWAVKRNVGRTRSFSYNRIQMRKDAPLAFRIQADLKKRLLKLAKQEARSLSQICEMLLKIGVDEYDEEGHKYLQKILISTREEDQK
jgi:hypothetical protein